MRLERVHIGGHTAHLDLTGQLLLPGLINAHDHLEFNLFPTLGRGPYPNASTWARDIYHPDRPPVRDHLRVPKPVRLWWGGLKNLLSGVTTVCHHNPYDPAVFTADFPVRVVRRVAWAHSLGFEPRPTRRRNGHPYLVHCAEGTDAASRRELAALDKLGALDSRTAVVHGVALDRAGLALMQRRRAGLVWCPTSNLKMLGRTISRAVLNSGIPIALATDSALSAPVDLLDEMAVARRYVSAARVYEMVTEVPARILQLPEREHDWIAMRESAVELVVIAGRVRLISAALARQIPRALIRKFQPVTLEGRPPVLVDAPVRRLYGAAAKHLGRDLRLAGKRILV